MEQQQLVNFIIRPPRPSAEYDPKNDLLEEEFILRGKWFRRKDVEIENSNGVVYFSAVIMFPLLLLMISLSHA